MSKPERFTTTIQTFAVVWDAEKKLHVRKDYSVRLSFDLVRIAKKLGCKAASNKGGKARYMSGAMLATATLLLSACAAPPPAPVAPAFERCMSMLGYKFHYTGDMIRAADWCKANDNGGMK